MAIDTTIDGLQLDGSLTLSERVDMNAKISLARPQERLDHLDLDRGRQPFGHGQYRLGRDEGGRPASGQLADRDPRGTPIELNANLDLVVGAKASFEVGVTTGVSEHADFTIGASYANGHFTPIVKPGFTASCTSPTLYGTADLKAYMGPQLSTTLYDVAGPTVGVDGYGDFDGRHDGHPLVDAARRP